MTYTEFSATTTQIINTNKRQLFCFVAESTIVNHSINPLPLHPSTDRFVNPPLATHNRPFSSISTICTPFHPINLHTFHLPNIAHHFTHPYPLHTTRLLAASQAPPTPIQPQPLQSSSNLFFHFIQVTALQCTAQHRTAPSSPPPIISSRIINLALQPIIFRLALFLFPV